MSRGKRANRTHSNKSNNDGLRDALSGIGGEKDILATGMMGFANYVTHNYTMLQRMFRSNIWVKKAVAIPANYAVKGWRKLESKKIEQLEKQINLKVEIAKALKWGELFGGSMVVFIVDDGNPPSEPINYNNLKPDSFKRLVVVDRWKVSFGEIERNPLAINYGEPEQYNITIQGRTASYHPSRCHKIIPNPLTVDEEVNEQYWGVSQIEIIYRQLVSDDIFLSSVANMMKKATVDIMGIPNLSNMIKNGQEDHVKERVRIAQSAMSTLNTWVKDAGHNGQNAETYERITQQFSGFDTMDIQSLNRIAAAAEIPATIFLGKSPDGMNATGDSDLSIFADRLTSIREIQIDPLLYKTDRIMAACVNEEIVESEWVNPFPKSEKDEADIRVLNMGVINSMAMLELPSNVIIQKMCDWNIIDSDQVDETIKAMDELEPYDIEDIEDESNMDKKSNGTYVSMNVKNGEDIYDWFIKQGVCMESPNNLHCTVSYSRKEFKHTPNMKNVIINPSNFIGIEPLGDDGAIVLKFNSDDMQERFNKCMTEGATYDYDSYIPHITLTYYGKDLDLSKIKLPNFDLVLGNETLEPLDLGWKEKTDTYKG